MSDALDAARKAVAAALTDKTIAHEQLEVLLTRLEAAEKTRPGPPDRRPLALGILTVVAFLVFLFAEIRPAELEIEGDIVSTALTIEFSQDGLLFGATSAPGVQVALAKPIFPLPANSIDAERFSAGEFIIEGTAPDAGTVTAEPLLVGARTRVRLSAQRRGRIELSTTAQQDAGARFRVTTAGAVALTALSSIDEVTEKLNGTNALEFDPSEGLKLELVLPAHAEPRCLICDPVEVRSVKFVAPDSDGVDSAIVSGVLRPTIGDELKLSEFDSFASESFAGTIRSVSIMPDGALRTRFTGTAKGATSGPPLRARPIALSYLERWTVDRSRASIYAAIVFLFGLVSTLLRWGGVKLDEN